MDLDDSDEQAVGVEIAGALARFFAGGDGPSHANIATAFALAGYDEPEGEWNKEQRVLEAIRGAPGVTARRIVDELVGELRRSGAFDRLSDQRVTGLRTAFSRNDSGLSREGYIDWDSGAGVVLDDTRVPRDADDLTEDQALFLEIVLQTFRKTSRWRSFEEIERQIIRSTRRSVSAIQIMESLTPPSERVFLSPGSEARLNVRLLILAGGDQEVADFLGLVALAVYHFFEEDPPIPVESGEVQDKLGLDVGRLRRLHALLQIEPNILGGGTSREDPYGWSYEVSGNVHHFMDVDSASHYLAVKSALLPSRVSSPRIEAARVAVEEGVDHLTGLHPDVLTAASSLFESGHYSDAVFAAFKAIEVRVRRQGSLRGHGRALMGDAFGGAEPALRVHTHSGEVAEDEQEGFKLVFMGVMQGIRNPQGHDFLDYYTEEVAAEYLALASLLFRRLDLAGAT